VIPNSDLRSAAAHFFLVDDWKVSETLTINLGFRLEANGQQSEAQGEVANFSPLFYVPPPRGDSPTPRHPGSSCRTITKGRRPTDIRGRTRRW